MSQKKIEVIKTMEGPPNRYTSKDFKDIHYFVKVNNHTLWVSKEIYEVMQELAGEKDELTE